MRRGNNPGWLMAGEKLVLANLGADYCAEHEWGIGGLKRMLGIDGAKPEYSRERVVYKKPHGIERRRISKHDNVRLFEYGDQVALICTATWCIEDFEEAIEKHGMAKAFKDRLPRELYIRSDQTLGAAWDDGSFGLLGKGQDADRIREIWKAIQAHNVAIWNGGRVTPFENSGLIIAIIDRVSAENLETMRAADEDAEKLQAASDATGIITRLKEAEKGYFACSPKWRDERFKDKNSAHPVIYWLNPMEQSENNSGWFTVEDLDQWIKGIGPIPMKAKV